VVELAEKLRECGFVDEAGRLETAYQTDARLFHLSTDDHRAVMSALEDCPAALTNLRAGIKDQLVDHGI
jgi:hypothetical protein